MGDEQLLFSVIIPAHNAEKTIVRAIKSVSLKLLNCEIIVVENGSIDNTTQLVLDLQKKQSNIKLIHSEKGVSRARNKGMELAKGQWISFVDADDIWEGSSEETTALIAKASEADIIACSYYKGDSQEQHQYQLMDTIISGDLLPNAVEWFFERPTIRMSVWSKLFRRDFLHQNHLFFNEKLRVSEDSEFIVRCLQFSSNIYISSLLIYRYCLDSESVIRSVDNTRTQGYIEALKAVHKDLEGHNYLTDRAFKKYVIAHLNLIAVHDVYNCECRMSWSERKKRMLDILREKIFVKVLQSIFVRDIKDLHTIPAFCFSRRMWTLGGLVCYHKSVKNRREYRNNRAG